MQEIIPAILTWEAAHQWSACTGCQGRQSTAWSLCTCTTLKAWQSNSVCSAHCLLTGLHWRWLSPLGVLSMSDGTCSSSSFSLPARWGIGTCQCPSRVAFPVCSLGAWGTESTGILNGAHESQSETTPGSLKLSLLTPDYAGSIFQHIWKQEQNCRYLFWELGNPGPLWPRCAPSARAACRNQPDCCAPEPGSGQRVHAAWSQRDYKVIQEGSTGMGDDLFSPSTGSIISMKGRSWITPSAFTPKVQAESLPWLTVQWRLPFSLQIFTDNPNLLDTSDRNL